MELDRFGKREEECTDLIDKWFFVLKNMKRIDALPPDFQGELFACLFQKMEIRKLTDEEVMDNFREILNRYDEYWITEYARQKGMEQGLKEGMEQGRDSMAVEIERSLKGSGMAVETICSSTGLSRELVDGL